jgi:hypothetical protein
LFRCPYQFSFPHLARRELGPFPGFTPTGLRNVITSVRSLDSELEQNGFKSPLDRRSTKCRSTDEVAKYPPIQKVRARYLHLRQMNLQFLDSLSDADLDKPTSWQPKEARRGVEQRQSWPANRGGLGRRDERRREVLRETRRGALVDAVNRRARESVEGKNLAPRVGLEPTTLRLTAIPAG